MKNNIKTDKNGKKVLLIGANGFLGSNILNLKNSKESIHQNLIFFAADLKNTRVMSNIPFYHLDITNSRIVSKTITKISPDVIILTAALTHVDQCEINKSLATKVNVEGPKNVVKASKKINSKLIFMSSDFIFDGTKEKGSYYSEFDPPNPLSHYAKTKFEAEQQIIHSEIDYLICRTAVLYGWNKDKLNFITWMLKNFEQNNKISIVKDQINSPTFIRNLAEIIIKLIEKDARGIYHTAGDSVLSRYEMAIQCAEVFGYGNDLIEGIDNLKQEAVRPKNVGLNINKLKNLIDDELAVYSFEKGLRYMKEHEFI